VACPPVDGRVAHGQQPLHRTGRPLALRVVVAEATGLVVDSLWLMAVED